MKLRKKIGSGLLALGLICGYSGIIGTTYYASKRYDVLKDTLEKENTLSLAEDYRARSIKFFLLQLASVIPLCAGMHYSLERRVSQ